MSIGIKLLYNENSVQYRNIMATDALAQEYWFDPWGFLDDVVCYITKTLFIRTSALLKYYGTCYILKV